MMLPLLSFVILNTHITYDDLKNAQEKIDQMPSFGRSAPTIIDKSNTQIPQLHILVMNTTSEDKDCCIITYCSFQKNYPTGIRNLIQSLHGNFRGHILYRIGGWPNMENGCLSHCDCPYGFKTCAFQEAFDLGYKKVLWLDASMYCLKDLGPIFDAIEQNTCIYRYSLWPMKDYINEGVLEDFHLSADEIQDHPHIAAGILGFNFQKDVAVQLLNAWHDSVGRKKGYFTYFPEQIPLSILLKRCGLADRASSELLFLGQGDRNSFFFDYRK